MRNWSGRAHRTKSRAREPSLFAPVGPCCTDLHVYPHTTPRRNSTASAGPSSSFPSICHKRTRPSFPLGRGLRSFSSLSQRSSLAPSVPLLAACFFHRPRVDIKPFSLFSSTPFPQRASWAYQFAPCSLLGPVQTPISWKADPRPWSCPISRLGTLRPGRGQTDHPQRRTQLLFPTRASPTKTRRTTLHKYPKKGSRRR